LDTAKRSSSTVLGVICGIVAAIFWAAGFAGVRHGLDVGFSPADLAVHRYLWSGLALLPVVVRSGIGNLGGVGWGRGILLTILGGPVFAVIGYVGFLLVPLGHGGVIQPSCGALGGLLLATLVLRETLVTSRLIGALIIVAGLMVIGGEGAVTIGGTRVTGDLIVAIAGFMSACFSTLLRLWQIAPLPAAAAIGVQSLFLLPAYWLLGSFANMISLGWRENLLQAILQGALAGPVALCLFVNSIAFLGAGRAAIFFSLVPPFVLLIGWLALGETPSLPQLIGLALVLLGFQLTQKEVKTDRAARSDQMQGPGC
jgi:drug/metabolite transporter (DMT)-like permease